MIVGSEFPIKKRGETEAVCTTSGDIAERISVLVAGQTQ